MLLVAVISAFVGVVGLIVAGVIANAMPFSNIAPVLIWISGVGFLVLASIGVMYLIDLIRKK